MPWGSFITSIITIIGCGVLFLKTFLVFTIKKTFLGRHRSEDSDCLLKTQDSAKS